ncbi:MAG: hypothetical protein IPJ21_15605 [Sterolibacteriaceae bacterium]|nr:hypothetical protein [Sterolibacteriaceae bacterium]
MGIEENRRRKPMTFKPPSLNDYQNAADIHADPARKLWAFKAAQAERSHVEASIRHSGCDGDFVTEQRGRPYSLLCTKNQASYENCARQRKKDLKDLARLEAPEDSGPRGN